MVSKKTQIVNKTGLHARPASDFVLKVNEFESNITIRNLDNPDANEVNARSILKILASSFLFGTNIEITADGPDEEKAVEELVALIESGFGE